ncbi:MAG: hypothetical protein ISR75_04190 [Phycisphaerales bacterium]|nr:hypothetical protein [Planctomycetota bacterium]MBL6997618.1 hypothetical protein [Phycisphaerales bacterium]
MANSEKPRINIPVVAVVHFATKPATIDATPIVSDTANIEETGENDWKIVGPKTPLAETKADACQAPKNPTNPVANSTIMLRIHVSIGT